jgi:hypothetical protein
VPAKDSDYNHYYYYYYYHNYKIPIIGGSTARYTLRRCQAPAMRQAAPDETFNP